MWMVAAVVSTEDGDRAIFLESTASETAGLEQQRMIMATRLGEEGRKGKRERGKEGKMGEAERSGEK